VDALIPLKKGEMKKAEIAAVEKHIEIVESGLKYRTLNVQLPSLQHTFISAAVSFLKIV
jgi:hypothetical protein